TAVGEFGSWAVGRSDSSLGADLLARHPLAPRVNDIRIDEVAAVFSRIKGFFLWCGRMPEDGKGHWCGSTNSLRKAGTRLFGAALNRLGELPHWASTYPP